MLGARGRSYIISLAAYVLSIAPSIIYTLMIRRCIASVKNKHGAWKQTRKTNSKAFWKIWFFYYRYYTCPSENAFRPIKKKKKIGRINADTVFHFSWLFAFNNFPSDRPYIRANFRDFVVLKRRPVKIRRRDALIVVDIVSAILNSAGNGMHKRLDGMAGTSHKSTAKLKQL